MINLVRADITTIEADAIVNAANAALAGGGGVDGAIHRAGGPAIMAECRRIGGCPPGGAVATTAGNLSAKVVIHAVAPIYRGDAGDSATLARAYAASLQIAAERDLRSIVFPSLGTGAYGYPIEPAARIALSTVLEHLAGTTPVELVTFALFSDRDLQVYERTMNVLSP